MTTLNNTLRLLQLQIQQSQSPAFSAFGAITHHPGTPTLPAPQVPALLVHDGLNKNDLHDPTVPVAVQVVLGLDMLENDDLTLYLGDTAVAVMTLSSEHLQSGIVTFYLLPFVFPQEGQVTLHYHHRVPPSTSFSVSEDVGPFLVKQTVPGNPDPDPSTPYVNERLTPPTGIPDAVPPGQPLTVTIPRYVNIAEGDSITLHWSDKEVNKTVSADEALNTAMPLTIVVPADIIDSTPGLGLIILYEIHDTVMNWSLFSLRAQTDVNPPDALHVPTVRDANDYDELDMDELDGDDIAIQIPVNTNLPVGTEGVLTWTGVPVLGPRLTYTQAFKIERASTRITLYVPNDKGLALVGSTVTVYYQATINGQDKPSHRATVMVIGQPVILAPPTLTGVTGDSFNPALIIGTHQEVVVPTYTFMAKGQTVILHWEGRTASNGPFFVQLTEELTRDVQIGQDISFRVEKIYATGLGTNTTLKVYYEIIAEGATYASSVLELTVMGVPSNLPKPATDPFFPGGEIDLAMVGATIQVVVQPNSVIQPGDSITLIWHGNPSASARIENLTFPMSGDLRVPIGKTPYIDGNVNSYVDVWYEVRRNNIVIGSSLPLDLHVGAAAELPWPLPKLIDASNTERNPWPPVKPGTQYDSNTATLLITDSRIQQHDVVGVVWRLPDQSDLTVPWLDDETAGEARIAIPEDVLAKSLGKTVLVAYAVLRGGQVIGSSAPTHFQIGALPPSALSELFIVEAAGSGMGPELDVSGLSGAEAHITVGKWPLIAVGQTTWLRLNGTLADNSAYVKHVLDGSTGVNNAWKDNGSYTWPTPASELKNLKDGSTLTVTLKVALDKGSNESLAAAFTSKTYTVKALVDSKPTITNVTDSRGPVANGGITFDAQVTVTGTATPNRQVEVFDGASFKGTPTANASGVWSLTVTGLGSGAHSITATALYGAGQTSNAYTFTRLVDSKPTITNVTDSRGPVANGGTTFDAQVTVTGTATPNRQVEVFDGAILKGTPTANASGVWSLTVTGLGNGAHSITATALYGAGQTSNAHTFTRLVDSKPTITNITDSRGPVANGGTTFDAQVTVTGTATANRQVEVYDGASFKGTPTANASGVWSLTVTGLAVGPHSVTAQALYGSGQQSSARTFSRVSQLVVDTSQLALAGKFYINVTGERPTSFPPGTSARRAASGGVPPYSYRSAQSSIANVDSSGLVVAQGNGTTSITVSDSTGQSATFQVTVSGVFVFRYSGSGQWYPPSNAGNILSREIMADIWNQCASHGGVAALGIPGGVYWTGTTSDNIRRYYTRNLSTGAEGTEAGQGIGTASHHILKRP